jgi:ubiquinone/menaquinone biosynthesis C-methylase UbiE
MDSSFSFSPEPTATVESTVAVGSGLNETWAQSHKHGYRLASHLVRWYAGRCSRNVPIMEKENSMSAWYRRGLVGCLLVAVPVLAQPGEPDRARDKSAPRYEHRADHDPNGSGKFYMGREIALVMGHQAAGWLDRPEREKEENPTKLLDALKLRPGDAVADIGAGSGYYSFRLAERVGAKGKVYAVDIQPEMLDLIRRRAKERKVTTIEAIQGTESDPRLPANAVDLILMVDVYHEFSHPWEMTEALLRSLKPQGRLVFVEFRLEDPKVPIKLVHKMSEKQVRTEMTAHAVEWVETIGTLPWQHVIVFRKKAAREEKAPPGPARPGHTRR